VVVASDTSSLPEDIGEAGLLANSSGPTALDEAMARTVLDRGLHDDLQRRGLARAAELSWGETAWRPRAALGTAAGESARSGVGRT